MMKIVDDKLTTLAKKIEPFVKKIIREMIDSGGSTNDQTFFYGTGFPKNDALGTRGTDAVDFQLNRDNSAQVAGGARLGGAALPHDQPEDRRAACGGRVCPARDPHPLGSAGGVGAGVGNARRCGDSPRGRVRGRGGGRSRPGGTDDAGVYCVGAFHR